MVARHLPGERSVASGEPSCACNTKNPRRPAEQSPQQASRGGHYPLPSLRSLAMAHGRITTDLKAPKAAEERSQPESWLIGGARSRRCSPCGFTAFFAFRGGPNA